MKTQSIDFRSNGIATVLQSPELAKTLIRATNVGTVVEQSDGTQAWFHIPITTHAQIATSKNNQTFVTQSRVESIYLGAKVNENAKIDRVHLRDGTQLIADRKVGYIDRFVAEWLHLSAAEQGRSVGEGLAVSIHVKFLSGTPRGRVELRSAGVRVEINLSP